MSIKKLRFSGKTISTNFVFVLFASFAMIIYIFFISSYSRSLSKSSVIEGLLCNPQSTLGKDNNFYNDDQQCERLTCSENAKKFGKVFLREDDGTPCNPPCNADSDIRDGIFVRKVSGKYIPCNFVTCPKNNYYWYRGITYTYRDIPCMVR
jgi:hypothetical protein